MSITEHGISRRGFLKAGGALVVLSAAVPAALRTSIAEAAAAGVPFPTPQLNDLSTWLTVAADGTVTWRTGHVELGQGNRTSLAQMVAEELDVAFEKVTLVMGDTNSTPDQGGTDGSTTVRQAGVQARSVAAEARATLLSMAAQQLGTPATQLTVKNGVVSNGSKKVSYGDLVQGKALTAVTPMTLIPGARGATLQVNGATIKPYSQYTIVGKSIPRVDIPDKVTAKKVFVHDVKVANMLHARVIHPKGIGSTVVSVGQLPSGSNAQVVQIQNLVAVVAKDEWDAIKGADSLQVTWSDWNGLPGTAGFPAALRATQAAIKTQAKVGDFPTAFAAAANTITATYQTPFENHGLLGPSCAVADYGSDGTVKVWSQTQYPQGLQKAIANSLKVAPQQVEIMWYDGSGCYGRMGNADDAASEAVLLSQKLGQPVRVQWMRADEHIWEPHSPGTLHDMSAGFDEYGNVTAWKHEAWMPPTSDTTLLGAVLAGVQPPVVPAPVGGWTGPDLYQFPNMLELAHALGDLGASTSPYPFGLRTTYMRSPAQYQITFSQEAFVDEVAAKAKQDPLQFRLGRLTDPRAISVLTAAAKAAKWDARPSPKPGASTQKGTVTGQGIAFVVRDGTYAAGVVKLEVTPKTGKVRLTEVTIAQDQGLMINPEAIKHQIQSCVLQTASRSLHEEVTFDTSNVTSSDWRSYPILRMDEAPKINYVLVPNPQISPTGVGEPAVNVMPGAISNAIFDATGVRLRTMPFTEATVKKALS